MAVSRRLRYEILRRDNHACTYCGATAPDVKLTVDHVVPVALGGSDEPSNLTTACADCNGGKSASSPDAPIVAGVEQDALRWSQAMQRAAEQIGSDLRLKQGRRQQFFEIWSGWTIGGHEVELPAGWEDAVDRFIAAGLPLGEVREAVRIAMTRRGVAIDDTFKYFCGVCWSKITELQKRAQEMLSADEGDENDRDDPWAEWEAMYDKVPGLEELEQHAGRLASAAAKELPDLDSTDVWYGTGPFVQQFGIGIKHRMLRLTEGLDLTESERLDIYQSLISIVRARWALARRGRD